MIIDRIENVPLYAGLGAKVQQALEYLAKTDFKALESGRYEIAGDEVFALVQRYETKPHDQGLWEAHRRYIDVQYLVSGSEIMGYAPLDTLAVKEPYKPENDCELLTGTGDFLTVSPRMFAVFFPQDAHMPGLMNKIPEPVIKVVVKVQCEN
ncbi:MAG: YhcH/YjgK/YiaL family protein [Kiritimatiellales bacterium]